ncbi:Hypothetical predicted protein [Podarcis lilfordi]|uniref:SPATA31 domain-containing protein n=1 Tax=Podarcis lilfordi TaxID=74358 RepID=A0AA35L8S1_9SAUR|nr:Hypothetical predicted protein [Podarcis lilfordi]
MKLASHLTTNIASSAHRKKGRGIVKGEREGKVHWHVLHWESTTRETALKSPPPSKANPQTTTGKKSFKARHKLIENSQRIIVPEEKKAPLPKLTLPHSSYTQRLSRPRPSLRGKADCVDMNVKYKGIQFLWAPPTLYIQPLSNIIPSAPELLAPPSWSHHTTEFVHARTPFLPANEEQCLESHVIRKRAQHPWGQPKLTQESLQKFHLPTAPHASSKLYSGGEVRVSPRSSLPFATLETKKHLEGHIEGKVIEQGWGIPKRVMESLHHSTPLTKEPKGSQEMSASHKGKRILGSLPLGKAPNFSGMPKPQCNQHQVLKRPVDQETHEISLELVDPMFHLPQSAGHQVKEHDLPKVAPLGLKAQQPQSHEVPFAEKDITVHIKLNIASKGLAHRQGLSTLYRKPLSYLYKEDTLQVPFSTLPRKDTIFDFTSAEIPFIEQRTREDLEWHVRKKRLQHAWGLPSLVQRSLHSVFPVVPQSQQHRTLQHVEVNVLLDELSFFSDAIIQELEQNLLKRITLHRWRLPQRVLESLRLLSPEIVAVAGKQDGTRIGRRTMTSQPLVYPTLQSETIEHKILHLDEKGPDISPTLARHTWQCMSTSLSQFLPKTLHSHGLLEPHNDIQPSDWTESMDQVESAMQHDHLLSLWGMKGLGGTRHMSPLQPSIPRTATTFMFSEAKTPFLLEQERQALELHIRKKKLQHEWGLPSLIQKSLHGFKSQAPPLPSLQRAEAHVYILLQKPSFLPQSTYSQLEFHIQRMMLQRQWKLPKRILESIKIFNPAFGTGPLELQNTEYQNKSCDSPGRLYPAIPVAREELSSWEEARQATFVGENIFTHGPKAYRAQQMVSPHQDTEAGEVPEGAFSESSAASTDHHSLRRKSTETGLQPMGSFKVTPDEPFQKLAPLYSQVKPRSTFLPLVEGEAVDKGELNIRYEYPEHLPSQQSEILNTIYADSAAWPHMDECFTGIDSMNVSLDGSEAREKPGINVYKEHSVAMASVDDKMIDLAASQDEAQEQLESYTKHKKIFHHWGLSQVVQKSMRAFCPPPPKSLPPICPQVTKEIISMDPDTEKEESATGDSLFVEDEKVLYWEKQQAVEQVDVSTKKTQRDKKMSTIDGIPQEIENGVPTEISLYSSKDTTGERPQMSAEDSVINEPLEVMKEVNNSPQATDALNILGPEAADNTYLEILQGTEEANYMGETPQRVEELVFNTKSPHVVKEELSTSESSQATEEARFIGLEATEDAASEIPQAADTVSGERSPYNTEEENLTYENTQVATSPESSKEDEEVAIAIGSLEATEDARAAEQQASQVSQVTGEEVTIAGESPQDLESESVTSRSSQASEEMDVAPEIRTDVAEDGEAPQAEEEIIYDIPWVTTTGSSQEDDEIGLMGENPQNREKAGIVPGSPPTPEEKAVAGESREATDEMDKSSEIAEKQSTQTACPSSKEVVTAERESPQAEEGVPGEHPPVTATESPQGEEGVRVANERSQVIVPEAEEAGCGRKPFQDTKQHGEAHSRRQAVTFRWGFLKRIQEFPQAFLLHLQPRYHRGYKLTGGLGDQSQAKTKSGLRKKPPVFRTELRLQVERGGKISICGATKKPLPLFSPKAHPSMVIPEGGGKGGSQEMKPGKCLGRPSYLKGRALRHKAVLKSTLHVHMQKMAPEQDSEIPLEPEKHEQKVLFPGATLLSDYNASPRSSQVPESRGLRSLDKSKEPVPCTCIERFIGDKCSISWQLESSLQGMVQNNQHPVGPRKPQPLDISHATASPCVCHTAVLQIDTKFPCVMGADQKCQQQQGVPRGAMTFQCGTAVNYGTQGYLDLPPVEGKMGIDCPKQEVSGDNLLKPSEVARDHLLKTHIAQRALGSFILPCLVISSHTAYEDMVAELVKKASKERQERLSSQLHRRRVSLGMPKEESQGLPLQTQGHRASARGQQKPSAVAYTQEPRSRRASKYSDDICSGMAPAPSLNTNNSSRVLQDQEDIQSAGESSSASSESSEVSGESEASGDSCASSLDANSELPDPPSDWIHLETKGEGVERESGSISILVPKDASQVRPETPCKQCYPQIEGQSQFSNVCEWQRAGDWDSDNVQVEEDNRDQKVGQRPKDRSCLKSGAILRPQGRRASSSSHKDSDKRMSIIGSVLERILHLKYGMHIWLQSHGIKKAAWREKKRQTFTTANCPEKEDMLKGAEEFRDAEPAMEGGAVR